jgi:hypothetical protein
LTSSLVLNLKGCDIPFQNPEDWEKIGGPIFIFGVGPVSSTNSQLFNGTTRFEKSK